MSRTWKLILVIVLAGLLGLGAWVISRIASHSISPIEITENGFQANFFAKSTAEKELAVIIIGGGQEGDYWAGEFAQAGLVGLSLPYSGKEGLPQLLEEIPLEYFEKAIAWLKQQPEVDPDKIILMGASRNAELALVIATTFPESISGLIAFAPSSISWSNTVLPYNSDQLKASWTYQGEAIPYLPMEKISGTNDSKIETLSYWQAGVANAAQYPYAIIPVEKINGPILLLSGKDDQIWPAAMMSDMIEKRLKEKAFAYAFENVQYENAGHLISRNLASIEYGRIGKLPIGSQTYEIEYGGTIEGDSQAIKDAKSRIMSFVLAYKR